MEDIVVDVIDAVEQQIADLDAEIDRLNASIDELQGELDAARNLVSLNIDKQERLQKAARAVHEAYS